MAPFVVFSLPRSRSTWLSVLLSSPTAPVGHDVGVECESISEFVERLGPGTCETGAAFAWRTIRQRIPEVRFAVVRRDPAEVAARLSTLGLPGQRDEMMRRSTQLDAIAALNETLALEASDLSDYGPCARLYEHCLGRPLEPMWFEKMRTTNVQIDLNWQIGRLVTNRARIERLKAEVAADA